jgi:hypothetical protein
MDSLAALSRLQDILPEESVNDQLRAFREYLMPINN